MNAIAPINHTLNDMQIMAESIARCGLFGMKTPDQALALMLVAQAEGMHPATITQDYDIIQGKACRKSHSVMARFQQTGGKVEWHELTDRLADATFSHPAGGTLRMQWTWQQAEVAKLTGKDNWKNYPRAMLRSRLIAEAIRAVYPAALGGMLLAEEAQDLPADDSASLPRPGRSIDPATGEIKPKELPAYTDEAFAKNLPLWRGLIESERKTAEQIIAMVSTKAQMTEEQLSMLRATVVPETIEAEQ